MSEVQACFKPYVFDRLVALSEQSDTYIYKNVGIVSLDFKNLFCVIVLVTVMGGSPSCKGCLELFLSTLLLYMQICPWIFTNTSFGTFMIGPIEQFTWPSKIWKLKNYHSPSNLIQNFWGHLSSFQAKCVWSMLIWAVTQMFFNGSFKCGLKTVWYTYFAKVWCNKMK